MKTIALALSLLAAGVTTPVFASDSPVIATETDPTLTLEELLARSRVSVGASRAGVLTELRAPTLALGQNVWIYTGFHATNVVGAERYDSLVIIFKNDKVEAIRLTKEEQVRVAAGRSAAGRTIVSTR